MSQVFPMRYLGDGMFRCLRTNGLDIEPQSVHGWQMAEHRSKKSHDQFFAIVKGAWETLPDHLLEKFPSSEHLRKYALCKAGYADVTIIACKSNTEAIKTGWLLSQIDNFAVIEISDTVLTCARAESQSLKAMGRRTFQESKEGVLRVISELIGTDAATLERQAA
jgi:hypothetical protein